VPLFLPLYGQRRQLDLRRIAVRESREDFRISGQINFDSGWEWGYWVNDVVTARASWDPKLPAPLGTHISQAQAQARAQAQDPSSPTSTPPPTSLPPSYEARQDQWSAYAAALLPITDILGHPCFS